MDEIKKLKIYTTNLNGTDEPTKGSIVVYSLNQPTKTFRDRLWEQPDKETARKKLIDWYHPGQPHQNVTDIRLLSSRSMVLALLQVLSFALTLRKWQC